MEWAGIVLFILCLLISVIQLVCHTAQTQADVNTLSLKNELAYETLRLSKESVEELATVCHNMLHQLSTLLQLARTGEWERLTKALEAFTEETEAVAPLRLTAHPTVNAILSTMLSRAKNSRVELKIHVELPESLPVPDHDLTNFLMNLLDNAIHAASALPEGEKRWVEFTMHIRKGYLFIEAKNSWNGSADFDEFSGLPRFRRGNGHGYGMKTLQSIARRYQSEIQVEAQKDIFLVRTALLMPKQ